MKRVFLGLLAAAVAVVTTSAPAAANPADATVSVGSGVLYSSTCQLHPYSYSVTLAFDETDWSLETDLIAPDGTSSPGDIVADSLGDPASGVGNVQLCGGLDAPGTYRLRATLQYFDTVNYDLHAVQLPDRAFTMRQPYSRTTVRLLKTWSGHHRVRVTAKDERPAGYFGIYGEYVYLQKWTGSAWARIRGTKTLTDYRGVATVTFRHTHKIKIRAVTAPTADYAGSYSIPIRFR